MGKLTTHILDTTHGCPAQGVAIRLYEADAIRPMLETRTNADGRCDAPLLSEAAMAKGLYRLEFDIAEYFKGKGVTLPDPAFLDTVVIRFGISDAKAHYHVPLLVSPFGYSTYRGS
jgi:5-hydroxyisourate hydrolase